MNSSERRRKRKIDSYSYAFPNGINELWKKYAFLIVDKNLMEYKRNCIGRIIKESKLSIENIFAINFMIILPYLFSPILLFYGIYERKTKKIKVKEKSEKAIYLGEIKYGLARVPSIQYDRYNDTKITSNEWTPLKTKGKLYCDFERNVNPHLIIAGKSGCGKTTTLIRIVNELSKFGKIIIIDFHGEYIGLSNLINAEVIDVANEGLNPLTSIANENYYEIANDLINSINIVDIYKLGITQESELMDSIITIKEKNL
ncbi:MAG: DUF87 domain-containing protein [Nitrososphaerota archaeon]